MLIELWTTGPRRLAKVKFGVEIGLRVHLPSRMLRKTDYFTAHLSEYTFFYLSKWGHFCPLCPSWQKARGATAPPALPLFRRPWFFLYRTFQSMSWVFQLPNHFLFGPTLGINNNRSPKEMKRPIVEKCCPRSSLMYGTVLCTVLLKPRVIFHSIPTSVLPSHIFNATLVCKDKMNVMKTLDQSVETLGRETVHM